MKNRNLKFILKIKTRVLTFGKKDQQIPELCIFFVVEVQKVHKQ
jgi:hypothetical protein